MLHSKDRVLTWVHIHRLNMDFVPSLTQRVKLLVTFALKVCQVPHDPGDPVVLQYMWRQMSTYPEHPKLGHTTTQSRWLIVNVAHHFPI